MSPSIRNEKAKIQSEKLKESQHKLHNVSLLIYHLTHLLELALALLLTAALVIAVVLLVPNLLHMALGDDIVHAFNLFLEEIFTLTVGVESLKMLCNHTPGSALEVLLFAMARAIVINHNDIKFAFVGILCITLVFATRKFLYVDEFDTKPEVGSIFSELEDEEPLFGNKPSHTRPHQHQMHTDNSDDEVSISFLKNLRNNPLTSMGYADQAGRTDEPAYTPIRNQND